MPYETMLKVVQRGTTDLLKLLQGTRRGALHVTKDLPDYATLVNENKVWRASQATATAAVIGSTYPTTACQLALYNAEIEGSGKTYLILSVGAVQIGAGAALAAWNIVFGVSQIKPTSTMVADIGVASIRPMKGNGASYNGRATLDLAPTLDVDPLYQPLPFGMSSANPVISLAGPGQGNPIHGLIVLPPSSLLALHVVAADTGVTTRLGIIWAELDPSEF